MPFLFIFYFFFFFLLAVASRFNLCYTLLALEKDVLFRQILVI